MYLFLQIRKGLYFQWLKRDGCIIFLMNFTAAFLIDHTIIFAYTLLALGVFFLLAKKPKSNKNKAERLKKETFIFPVFSEAFHHLGKRKHDPGKCFQFLVLLSTFFWGGRVEDKLDRDTKLNPAVVHVGRFGESGVHQTYCCCGTGGSCSRSETFSAWCCLYWSSQCLISH